MTPRTVIGYEMGQGAHIREGYLAGRYGRFIPAMSQDNTKKLLAGLVADARTSRFYNWTSPPILPNDKNCLDPRWWCVVEVLEPETNEWGEVCL